MHKAALLSLSLPTVMLTAAGRNSIQHSQCHTSVATLDVTVTASFCSCMHERKLWWDHRLLSCASPTMCQRQEWTMTQTRPTAAQCMLAPLCNRSHRSLLACHICHTCMPYLCMDCIAEGCMWCTVLRWAALHCTALHCVPQHRIPHNTVQFHCVNRFRHTTLHCVREKDCEHTCSD